jgi:NodT family efflux transporter outer membrane factor (OMF) lipoprotein
MKNARLWLGIGVLSLAGCAVGPDYVRPPLAATAAQFKEAQGWKIAAPADRITRGAWWQVFADPDLDRLEQQLNLSNQNIALAAAQYSQSQALLQEAQAGLMPTLGLSAAMTRGHAASSSGVVSNAYSTALSASWEPDLWGKVRRTVEAGKAGEQAGAASLENARLSYQAQLAVAYLQLYVTDRQAQSLNDSVLAYQQELKVTQNQYAVGVAGQADVLQAQNQLETLQVQAEDMTRARALLEHAIAVLVGQSPSSFTLGARTLAPHLPQIPPLMPSALLERRPDIAASERQVAQANAEIGVARAAYFPDLTLSASGGYVGSNLANWISLPNRVWSLGPALAETLFDGGLRAGQNAAAQASYDQSVASYRQTVLSAFQDVEDNLAAQRVLSQEAVLQHQAVDSARKSAQIVRNQYQAGTASFLNLAQANATQQASERAEFAIINSQLTSAVGLIKALGGGYPTPS